MNPSNEYLALLAKIANDIAGRDDPWPSDWAEYKKADRFRDNTRKVLKVDEG